MRRYELMLLLSPDLEDDKLQAAVEKVTRSIVNAGGSLSKVSPWGKRRLAYDIQRHREASYFLIHFDIEPAQVREIERGMLISEEILRHLVTVLEDRESADELAPAAMARETGDGEEADGDDGTLAGAGVASTATATVTTNAPDAPDAPEGSAAETSDDESSDDDTSVDTSDDAPGGDVVAPVNEERAEG
ncbi:MAG: 30S ribosomal protein S6 [Candidatus Limnocylindria bacterium]